MSSAEQTVTWLITLGVLHSPKKRISDPDGFLRLALLDGVVLCRLLERLMPGSIERVISEPKSEQDCVTNIRQFLKGLSGVNVEPFEPNDLCKGQNFDQVLNCLVSLNRSTTVHRDGGGEEKTSRPRHGQARSPDMLEGGGRLVRARFDFARTNEDELSFAKGDMITVTRVEEGGWWEGTLHGRTGWFPSNYVRETKACEHSMSPNSKHSGRTVESTMSTKGYYNVVTQNIVETEHTYSKELQILLCQYLRPLQVTEKISQADISLLVGNLEDIAAFQQGLVQSLEELIKLPEMQQRVGGHFMAVMDCMCSLYLTYCANHPSAVRVLQDNSEVLAEFMESCGASSPGLLILTTSLSRPFMRLEKYPTLLRELERHTEDSHPDKADIQRSMVSFKLLTTQCMEIRKRKELELQILMEPIRGWEGDDIKSLGGITYMSQVLVQTAGNEEKAERFLLLFPNVLVLLSASSRMSAFIFQGRLPLHGLNVVKVEDEDSLRHSFEISGGAVDRLMISCSSSHDAHEWLELLQRHGKGTMSSSALLKAMHSHSLPSSTSPHGGKPTEGSTKSMSVNPGYHTLPLAGSHGGHGGHQTALQIRGHLEPPRTAKPWSLSCLRPAPPLRPSAALIYKEDLSKSPKTMKKLLSSRKTRKPSDEDPGRKSSSACLEEDTQILKVIEAYCTSAKTRQTLNSICNKDSTPQVLLPEEEKIIVEERRSNGQTVIEEKSLVDTVYALREQVQELKQDTRRLRQGLEEEARARKSLEKIMKRCLKLPNGSSWDETNL
uniref:rho guanine nucleotide exchange factor 7-like isoform X1 n=1 Tax=Myxine glutinosa TaxID=7769 RepID=UPI00358FC1E1